MSKVSGKYLNEADFKSNSATGNGSTSAFALSDTPISIHALWVYVDGLFQRPITDYTLSGDTVTFITTPAQDQSLDFRYIKR